MGEVTGSSPVWSTASRRVHPSAASKQIRFTGIFLPGIRSKFWKGGPTRKLRAEREAKAGRSIVVVYTLRVREVRVRFSAPRQQALLAQLARAHPSHG